MKDVLKVGCPFLLHPHFIQRQLNFKGFGRLSQTSVRVFSGLVYHGIDNLAWIQKRECLKIPGHSLIMINKIHSARHFPIQ